MKKPSRRYSILEAPPRTEPVANFEEAVSLLLAMPSTKFDETVELSVHLNLEKKHTVRDALAFPNSFGKSKKVLVFAKGEKADEAKAAGADYVGAEDLVEKIEGGWLDFEVAVATPDMMRTIAKIARVLGTRGLMPNPKAKTVTTEIAETVKAVKAGRREFRANEGVVNMAVGKKSMKKEALVENLKFFYSVLLQKKPNNLKGDYVKSVTLSSTMGKGIAVNRRNLT